MFAMIDPERPEVRPAIEKAYNAGIRVVAISGDYTKTLYAICKNIGLLPPNAPESKVMDCENIRKDGDRSIEIEDILRKQNDAATVSALKAELDETYARLDKITNYVDAFGRAKPADKITILKSLQRQGHIASMTGDGVNDAPALKQANIGVAMGITGTDAAKAASSIVLTDDSFSSIVAGVQEGRAIFRNISIFIYLLLSENIAEALFCFTAPCVLGQPAPLEAIQLLLLNLFTDGAPAIALAVEDSGNDLLMTEGPRGKNEFIISKLMAVGMVLHATVLTGLCVLMYTLALTRHVTNSKGDVSSSNWQGLSPCHGIAEALCYGCDWAKQNITKDPTVPEYACIKLPNSTKYLSISPCETLTTKELCIGCGWTKNDVCFPVEGSKTFITYEEELKMAQTTVFLFILLAELFRAPTSRSLRESIFSIGFCSNRWMLPAVFVGLAGGIMCATIPGLNELLGFRQIDGTDWAYICGFMFIPCIFEEIVKLIYRKTGFGIRQKAVRGDLKQN